MTLTTWRDSARRQLQTRRANLTLDSIAKSTGISYEWLIKFQQGKMPDPSVNRIETLLDFFARDSSNAQ